MRLNFSKEKIIMKFFLSLGKIRPVYDAVYKGVLFVCKILLIADILITCFAVLGRFVSFIPDPAWTEEVVLTLMAYMAVLSAALAIRRDAHIRMTSFDRFLPKTVLKILDLVADVAVFAFGIIMLTVGLKYAINIGSKGTYVSLTWLSRFWLYFPVPVAGFAMIVFELEAIYNHILKLFKKEDKESCTTQQ